MKNFLKNVKLQTLISVSFILLFAVSALVAIIVVNYNMKKASLVEAENKVHIISDAALSIHTYYSHQLKPVLFQDFDGCMKKDNFRPEWMSSTFAVREILKYFQSMSDFNYYYKECAINARSPENEADEFEKEFIQGLNDRTGEDRISLIREYDGKPFFVSLKKGETMDRSCLRCHTTAALAPKGLVEKYGDSRSFARVENEVVSAISVRIPLGEAYENADHFSFVFSIYLLGILLILLISLLFLNQKLIFTPLNILRERTDCIAGNYVKLNEMIDEPFGKELSTLTSSFNSMSSTINDYLVNLELKVEDRTRKLKEYSLDLQNEVDERKRAGEELKKILSEKEILIKEVHHRVKNNFNVISSLITLKSSAVDEKAKEIFVEVDQSLKTMSRIHEFFYKSEKITDIDIGEYFNSITHDLVRTFNLSGREVKINKDIESVTVNLNQAITCGLLLNEIISNAMKYAFPADWAGEPEINISLKNENSFIEIRIGDNGCGIPAGVDRETSDSLGLTLIYMFPEQLNGTITAETQNGTGYCIRFPGKA
ncbi:MAG: hypothetical protein CVV49_20995 [Spirochaetae bacterium HGW-Spirochaetae-5]|nr:MAG: hypothetical protein CVV49_20995 [Spirochaetae bacterium HGW-Spirochaetae-5]